MFRFIYFPMSELYGSERMLE